MESVNASKEYSAELYMFEKDFDQAEFHSWMQRNWFMSIVYALLYVLAVHGGQKWMENRERFSLRTPLIIWSSGLAVFSIIGFIRTLPEFIYVLKQSGFEGTVCDNSYLYGSVSFWANLFVMSKFYELGDTVFIILRKQRLVFLHWYHHATVLMYTWFSITGGSAAGRWFMVMNYFVHSLMYTYYAIRAMGYRLPKYINILITTTQLCQMLMGLTVVLKVYYVQSQGRACVLDRIDMHLCLMMYASYLGLFAHFFHQTYLAPKSKAKTM